MNVAVMVAAGVVLAAPLVARAQPSVTDPLPPSQKEAPPVVDDSDDKSPGLALGLSLLGTAAGYATLLAAADTEYEGLWLLGLGGIVVGPSLGHFYAGETGRGAAHCLVRVGAAGAIAAGAVITFADCFGDEESDCNSAGPVIMIGGAVLGIGSTLYSIVDSPAAASRHNEARRRPRFVLTPAPVVGPDRSTGYGMAVAAQF